MENQINKKESKILSAVKFVGITFDPNSYKKGQEELNHAIKMGYKVLADYPTSLGVVFSVGLYENESEDIMNGSTVFPTANIQPNNEAEKKWG